MRRIIINILKGSNKYKECNHHHELTVDHELVNFGDGVFVANTDAVLLLQELNRLGLRTRTHHITKEGDNRFFSILLDKGVNLEVREVNEVDADRTKYNGQKELLISWSNKVPFCGEFDE